MDKQINLFRNVFKEEQARRRRASIGFLSLASVALCVWAGADYSARSTRAVQEELAKMDILLDAERGLVATLSKAQKEAAKLPEAALNQSRAAELDRISSLVGGGIWNSIGELLRGWKQPRTRLKKLSFEKGVLSVSGEAVTQEGARLALVRIGAALGADKRIRTLRVEFKAIDAVVAFTWIGAVDEGPP